MEQRWGCIRQRPQRYPAGAVALLLGADRVMDSMRVSVNLLGNCVATPVVAKWERQLDGVRLRKVLDDAPVGAQV